MDYVEAAELISVMAESVRREPNQFSQSTQSTKVVGQELRHVTISTTGGGPGSRTTGMSTRVSDSGNITSSAPAPGELAERLDQLAAALRAPTPDKSSIREMLEELRRSWAPNIVWGVAANVVSKALGL